MEQNKSTKLHCIKYNFILLKKKTNAVLKLTIKKLMRIQNKSTFCVIGVIF